METCLDPIWYLEDTLSEEMKHILGENCSNVCRLQVKRKPNQHGDVHIPGFARNVAPNIKDDHCQQVAQKVKSSSQLNKYIKDLNLSSNGQLNLCLDKAVVMAALIRNVISSGDKYGLFIDSDNKSGPLLEHGDSKYVLNANNSDSDQWFTSLDCLRLLVTSTHLQRLLNSNGIPASISLSVVQSESLAQSTIDTLAMFNNHLTTAKQSDYQETNKKIEKALCDSQFVYQVSDPGDTSKKYELVSSNVRKNTFFDCQKYRQNISLNQIPLSNIDIQKLSELEVATADCKDSYVIHLTSQRRLYSSQQHGLIWEALSAHSFSQIYLALGDITLHDKQQQHPQQKSIQVEELLRLRESQVRSAYLLKYGEIVQGQGWDDSIKSVAVATLKLQILAVSQTHQVRFDVSKEAQDFRPLTFILYNCARLSKLFHHYEEAVQQGLYPPLPDIDHIDFSLLREKDEWNLVLRYVTVYPSIVRDLLHGLLASSKQQSLLRVNINKITCFLLDLSQDFSSYYGRTHVLGEPRRHLFPTMFARLYLLKAIQQVFHNCLDLLDVQPLSQM